MLKQFLLLLIVTGLEATTNSRNTWPVVVATWDKRSTADAAWNGMQASKTQYKSLDGVVTGVQFCQTNCNVGSANVDTQGQVTQSAMVIYGPKMVTGSVANIYDIDDAVGVARAVLMYTEHAILVGEAATRFAVQNGFERKNLYNNTNAQQEYENWILYKCDHSFWRNVENGDCSLINGTYDQITESDIDIAECDTNELSESGRRLQEPLEGGMVTGGIAVIAIDENGEMSMATSANTLNYKISGRVSHAAIPGAGGYIDPSVGGCTGTGHGDTVIRFSPAAKAVTYMKTGLNPQQAAQLAVDDVMEQCPYKQIIVLCLSKNGTPGIGTNPGSTTNPYYAYRSDKCEAAVSANIDHPRGTCI